MRPFAILLLLASALVAPPPAFAQAAGAARPNVIFILSDDLGYGDLGCYGQQKIKTPNIDRLAREGVRFTQAYAGSPVCGPSRCTLLTGLHTGHSFVRGNPGQSRGFEDRVGDPPLPADTFTFAKLYKDAGYRTAVIGKWGMGNPGTSGDPKNQGFDSFFGYATHVDAHDYYPDHLWRNEQKVPLDGKTYSHDLIADEGRKFVRDSVAAKQPFLLYHTFTIPHSKMTPPTMAPYENEKWPDNEKKFAAMITRMDGDVGKLLDLLKELKVDDNTLVVFTSDNGPTKEGHSAEFFDSNGPLRGIKRDVYEGGIRVPFIARWPGHVPAGKTSDLRTAFCDWLPTSAELLGASAPAKTDGISILPALLGKPGQKHHDALYWEFQEQGGKQAIRFGDWKAVRLNVSTNADAPIELYDLSSDLGETKDLAADKPDIVAQAKKLLAENHVRSDRFPLFPDELAANPKKPRKRGTKQADE
jgi:arylsulfatase A-like enzyme